MFSTADGSTVPTHWYRMKAFDEAADFGKLTEGGVGEKYFSMYFVTIDTK